MGTMKTVGILLPGKDIDNIPGDFFETVVQWVGSLPYIHVIDTELHANEKMNLLMIDDIVKHTDNALASEETINKDKMINMHAMFALIIVMEKMLNNTTEIYNVLVLLAKHPVSFEDRFSRFNIPQGPTYVCEGSYSLRIQGGSYVVKGDDVSTDSATDKSDMSDKVHKTVVDLTHELLDNAMATNNEFSEPMLDKALLLIKDGNTHERQIGETIVKYMSN